MSGVPAAPGAVRLPQCPSPAGWRWRGARFTRDQGRAGKGVTLVKGLPLEMAELTVLGKQLKAACGSGGTVKDGVIEVQGDHVERVMAALVAQGFVVKRSGG